MVEKRYAKRRHKSAKKQCMQEPKFRERGSVVLSGILSTRYQYKRAPALVTSTSGSASCSFQWDWESMRTIKGEPSSHKVDKNCQWRIRGMNITYLALRTTPSKDVQLHLKKYNSTPIQSSWRSLVLRGGTGSLSHSLSLNLKSTVQLSNCLFLMRTRIIRTL